MRMIVNTLIPDDNIAAQQTKTISGRQPVLIHAHDKPATPGMFFGKHFTPAQRYRRAALSWGLMWLLAVVSAFIPIAHFLLVPVFAIAGPVLGYRRYQQETIADAIEGKCPSCRHEFHLQLDQQTTLPYRDVCPNCDRHIQILAKTGSES